MQNSCLLIFYITGNGLGLVKKMNTLHKNVCYLSIKGKFQLCRFFIQFLKKTFDPDLLK